ncbi:MAG: hypothetical protein QMC78_04630 [Methanocellales archaeon]|nr:hypothetical protein [Methanocellales archaeon]
MMRNFRNDRGAQIITLVGVIVALTIVLLAIVINAAAISGQKTVAQEVDDVHYVFKNVRDVYGDVLRQVSDNGSVNPFNPSLTAAELNMTRMCNAHGYAILFRDKFYDGFNATAKIIFSDGQTVYTDTVVYRLRAIHVYDFATGAGIDKWAYKPQCSPKPPTSNDVPNTEFTSNDYNNISSDDGIMQEDSAQQKYYAAHRFNFTIEEDAQNINQIHVFWNGKGINWKSKDNGATLYIWNYTSNSYKEFSSNSNESEVNLTGTITSNVGDYIDNGYLIILVEQNGSANPQPWQYSKIYTDYVKVEVLYQIYD